MEKTPYTQLHEKGLAVVVRETTSETASLPLISDLYVSQVAKVVATETNLCVLGDMVSKPTNGRQGDGFLYLVSVMNPAGEVGVVDVRMGFREPFIRSIHWKEEAVLVVESFLRGQPVNDPPL